MRKYYPAIIDILIALSFVFLLSFISGLLSAEELQTPDVHHFIVVNADGVHFVPFEVTAKDSIGPDFSFQGGAQGPDVYQCRTLTPDGSIPTPENSLGFACIRMDKVNQLQGQRYRPPGPARRDEIVKAVWRK